MPARQTTAKAGAPSKGAKAGEVEKKTVRAGHGTRRPRQTDPDESGDENLVDGQFVVALSRGLEILRSFRAGVPRMSNHDFAEKTGLPKPTISRLTHTLTKQGFLSYVPRVELYELGPEALSMGFTALSNIDVRRIAHPLMQRLADESGFNVGLGMRDRHLMMYADACEGKALVGLTLRPGSRIPIVTTAMGRAYLASLEDDEREELLVELRGRHGDDWPVISKDIERSLKEVAARGFCTSLGDWQRDIHGVAAPIRAPGGQRTYAINMGAPKYLLSEEQAIKEWGPKVAAVAQSIEKGIYPGL